MHWPPSIPQVTNFRSSLFCLASSLALSSCVARDEYASILLDGESGKPKLHLWSLDSLDAARASCDRENKRNCKNIRFYVLEAENALVAGDCFVTDKLEVPPSGDKRDYMSVNSYLWPDPNQPNGLPYIHKDGQDNAEVLSKWPDRRCLQSVFDRAYVLSIGWYLTGRDEFARRARDMIFHFFLSPARGMNPNMNFAQAHPGKNTGQHVGIVEIAGMPGFLEALAIVKTSQYWTSADNRKMNAWLSKMLSWLLESDFGKREERKLNNHGTRYDATVVSIALAIDREEVAKQQLETVSRFRIKAQIAPDGSQPDELRRTNALGYSLSNLESHLMLSRMAHRVALNHWNYESNDGRSLTKALEFIAPHLLDPSGWPYQQIKELKPRRVFRLFKIASLMDHRRWTPYLAKMPEKMQKYDRSNVIY